MTSKNKSFLSVTLATYNEEAVIERCIKSFASIADEVIIVDGSSSDKTSLFAKKLGAKVYKTTNKPNFHINKALANKKAKGDWILQMDADEFVTLQLAKEIQLLLEGKYFGYSSWQSPLKKMLHGLLPFVFKAPLPLTAPASAYFLTRKNFFLSRYLKHTGQYPDPVIRLFQNGKAHLPAKNVHEQMVVKGRIGWMRGDLDHYATPHFSRYLLRENRYSSLTAEELKNKKVKVSFFNTVNYLFLKPLITFSTLYIRYRGFLDGFPGFVFSLFSGLHHALAYMKLWELYQQEKI